MAALLRHSVSPSLFLGGEKDIASMNGRRSFGSVLPLRKSSRQTCFAARLPGVRASLKEDGKQDSISHEEVSANPVQKVATSAVTLLAIGALLLVPAGDALAAKSGGRVGGSQFRAPERSQIRSAPRPGPRINNSSTNIYVAPPSPPIFGGYGYAPAVPFGGYGWSPFSYGPSVAIGVPGGGFFSFLIFLFVGGFILNIVLSLFRRRDDDY